MPRSMKLITTGAVMALALSACASGGGGTSPSDTGAPASPDATSSAPGTDAPATDKPEGTKVEIAYMHRLPDGDGMTKVADIVKKWNDEHPDIQVTPTKFDGKAAEMITKLQTDINAGTAPCLAQLGYAEVPEMFVKGMLIDVTSEAEKYKDNFGGAYGQMSMGGITVGLPQDSGPLVYMYNAEEFKKLGIEVPTNIDGFVTAAKAAAAKGKYIAAFTADEAAYWLSAQAAAAGDAWYSTEADQWKVDTTGEGSQRVAAMWQDLLDSKAVLVMDRWADGFNKALTDGQLIGHVAAAWETGFTLDPLDDTPAEGQWRVAQLPDYGVGPKTGPDGGSGVAVLKGCEHPAEAMEFNDWFNTQVDDLASQGLVPAATKAATTPEKMSRQFGGQDVMAELVKANESLNTEFIYIPGFSAVQPKMTEQAAAVGQGKAEVKSIFDAARTASVDALKAAQLPVAEN